MAANMNVNIITIDAPMDFICFHIFSIFVAGATKPNTEATADIIINSNSRHTTTTTTIGSILQKQVFLVFVRIYYLATIEPNR